ncbi:hypothetical protein [Sinomicrobium sp.]
MGNIGPQDKDITRFKPDHIISMVQDPLPFFYRGNLEFRMIMEVVIEMRPLIDLNSQ